jgi:hypothetical protein
MQEEIEDTKEVIRIHKSKNDRQHNDQKKKDKQRSTKHTHKTKEQATQTPLKTGDELRWSRCASSSCSIGGTRHVTLVTNLVISKFLDDFVDYVNSTIFFKKEENQNFWRS